jgi:hypothetical protein
MKFEKACRAMEKAGYAIAQAQKRQRHIPSRADRMAY